MSLTDTPNANRLHIALFGRRNSGKSSLINALTGQDTAIVSNTPGTTTDLVSKAMEVHGIGACLFMDTPGFDDEGELGEMRIVRTLKAIEKTDIALLLCEDDSFSCENKKPEQPESEMFEQPEHEMLKQLKEKNIPVILILNKIDIRKNIDTLAARIEQQYNQRPLLVSAKERTGIEEIRQAILEKLPSDFGQQSITGALVAENDLVLLVMPQDIQAPKGRLILPQVQTIRELLDKKCLVMTCTTDKLSKTLQALARPPKLIITDSQVFRTVYEQKPDESKLTSFSVLFAGYKGDIHYYVESAAAIESLTESSRILIAEACTHAPLSEDIGRVKLPRLLRKRIGEKLQIDIVSGTDFPQDLTPYSLVIHCGACMFNRKYVLSRIERAREQHIPMTNYGVAIAYLNGILNQIEY
ncbi:[FeFe] hydrogenase H-cluster maturation GTPase HydF [uncultured Bacteroides sp.]|uniref:[FeFe] hydrogenase H-cluster maturation GTPase HydF n=1 Tax=uncultured Bacteroides sp. TaxID=162156 RepID=UPI0027DB5AFA|nr:[FeFe] hydrogenase H-cluster maturation GTPase HydF [uncultured Bacteroides sp.]